MSASPDHLGLILSRLGLSADESDETWLRLTRRDQSILARRDSLACQDAPARSQVAFALLGVRYSLDYLADQAAPPPAAETPLRFRRTSLRRYQEVEPEHGDRLPRLVLAITAEVFHHLTGERPLTLPWIIPGLELLALRERGLSQQVLTEEAFAAMDEEPDVFWERVRRALFYEAYKRRPQLVQRSDGPDLRAMESVEGLGATRAHLYPEFDYDLAQDGGLLSIPSMDTVLLADEIRDEHYRSLQEATEERFQDALFPLSRALLAIHTEGLTISYSGGEPALLGPDVTTIFVRE